MRAVHAALALLLAAAGAKNHGDELALFVRQYAEKTQEYTPGDQPRGGTKGKRPHSPAES